MRDPDQVSDFGFRCPVHPLHLGSIQRAAKEHTHFEKVSFRPYEEITEPTGEHDRFMRGVDFLIAERHSGLAQPLPRVSQIIGKAASQGCLRGCPTVMLLTRFNPLFAVVACSPAHKEIVTQRAPGVPGMRFRYSGPGRIADRYRYPGVTDAPRDRRSLRHHRGDPNFAILPHAPRLPQVPPFMRHDDVQAGSEAEWQSADKRIPKARAGEVDFRIFPQEAARLVVRIEETCVRIPELRGLAGTAEGGPLHLERRSNRWFERADEPAADPSGTHAAIA